MITMSAILHVIRYIPVICMKVSNMDDCEERMCQTALKFMQISNILRRCLTFSVDERSDGVYVEVTLSVVDYEL